MLLYYLSGYVILYPIRFIFIIKKDNKSKLTVILKNKIKNIKKKQKYNNF